MANKFREIDFGALNQVKDNIVKKFEYIITNNKVSLFVISNILLYTLFWTLALLRLFGVI